MGRVDSGEAERPTYWLTRAVLLRGLGLIYFVAFLSLVPQVVPLVGSDGLLPARLHLDQLRTQAGGSGAAFVAEPGLFWLGVSDASLRAGAWIGLALSVAVVAGFAN